MNQSFKKHHQIKRVWYKAITSSHLSKFPWELRWTSSCKEYPWSAQPALHLSLTGEHGFAGHGQNKAKATATGSMKQDWHASHRPLQQNPMSTLTQYKTHFKKNSTKLFLSYTRQQLPNLNTDGNLQMLIIAIRNLLIHVRNMTNQTTGQTVYSDEIIAIRPLQHFIESQNPSDPGPIK